MRRSLGVPAQMLGSLADSMLKTPCMHQRPARLGRNGDDASWGSRLQSGAEGNACRCVMGQPVDGTGLKHDINVLSGKLGRFPTMHAAGVLYDKQTSPDLGRVLKTLEGAEAAQFDPYQRAVVREARRCCSITITPEEPFAAGSCHM